MSSQVFTAVILNADAPSVEALLQALKSKDTRLECISAYSDASTYDECPFSVNEFEVNNVCEI